MTRCFIGSAVASALLVASLNAQQDRIPGALDANRTKLLAGHMSPRLGAARDLGLVPDAFRLQRLTLILNRSLAQQADLDRLLEQQRLASSPWFHRWLSPEEFADRFGLSPTDLQRIATWLQSQGLTVEETARSRGWVSFSGAAADVTRAFGTPIHFFEIGGERHFANTSEPRLPEALHNVALGIEGLNSFRPRSASRSAYLTAPVAGTAAPPACNNTGLCGSLTPQNFSIIYGVPGPPSSTLDGSGQTIVVVGQADPGATSLLNDVGAFRAQITQAGAAASPPVKTQLAGVPPATPPVAGDWLEADVELEWAGAIAPNAQLVYAYSNDAFATARSVVSQMSAPFQVLILSAGVCEGDAYNVQPLALRALAQQANAQGITWVAPSGDAGPAACDAPGSSPQSVYGAAVMLPASVPEVTAVGGTEFIESAAGKSFWNGGSATSYIPEAAWNDTPFYNVILATGGGFSKMFQPKPVWQQGLTNDAGRDVPDLAFAASGAHDPYLIVSTAPVVQPRGGTTAAAAAFAGIVALLNQAVSPSRPSGSGNINPNLYSLATSPRLPVFHDVISGNNTVACLAGSNGCTAAKTLGSSATRGYDEATGWGSLDAGMLIQAWKSATPQTTSTLLVADPISFSPADTVTLTAIVTPASGAAVPTGQVNFLIPGPNGQMISAGSVQIPNQTTGTATATLALSGSQLPIGPATLQAVYSGDVVFGGSLGSAPVTVEAIGLRSAVVPLLTNPVPQLPALSGYNWSCAIQLQNYSRVPTTLTKFAVGTPSTNSSGVTTTTQTDLTGSIQQIFGTATIPGMSDGKPGTLAGVYGTNIITPPELVTFTFSGVDPSTLFAWNVQNQVEFNGPPPMSINLVNGATLQNFLEPIPGVTGPPDVAAIQQPVFAPGMMMALLGANGLPATFNAVAPPNAALPTSFLSSDGSSSISVTINGTPAPLYSATPNQIDLQAPYELQNALTGAAPNSIALLALNNSGLTTSYSFMVGVTAPAIFTSAGIKNVSSGSFNSQTNPAAAGTVVTVYFTGAGALSNTVADGALDGPSDALKGTVTAMLQADGSPAASSLSFSAGLNNASIGMAPGMAGIAQVTFTLPSNLAAGMYQVSVAIQTSIGTTSLPLVTSNSVPVWVCNGNCAN